ARPQEREPMAEGGPQQLRGRLVEALARKPSLAADRQCAEPGDPARHLGGLQELVEPLLRGPLPEAPVYLPLERQGQVHRGKPCFDRHGGGPPSGPRRDYRVLISAPWTAAPGRRRRSLSRSDRRTSAKRASSGR